MPVLLHLMRWKVSSRTQPLRRDTPNYKRGEKNVHLERMREYVTSTKSISTTANQSAANLSHSEARKLSSAAGRSEKANRDR
jgi:hypothetical protein